MAKVKYSEKQIQKALKQYVRKKGHLVFAPNIYMFKNWEMDFASLNKQGFLYEFEIKISKSDFWEDFKKVKHKFFRFFLQPSHKMGNLNRALKQKVVDKKQSPNYFYYVVPWGLIEKKDVPNYAGLIYMSPVGKLVVKKPAKRLHSRTNSNAVIKNIAISLSHRF